jgi:hypothetical protein
MKEQTREYPKILAAAERQMHAWVMNGEIADRAIDHRFHQAHVGSNKCFVAISRETGAGGSEVASIAGKILNWRVFDQNLLDCIAKHFNIDRNILDLVDETHSNWVYDVLGTWMDSKIVPHETFVRHLSRVILAEANQGNAIFVGRGAAFLLPRNKVLAVRLVASEDFRVKRLMQTKNLREGQAQKMMREFDKGRSEFAMRFFHHDITDSHLYDMVINTECLGMTGAAEKIVAAVCMPPTPASTVKV